MGGDGRLVVVSNRLPITMESTENGKRLQTSYGGLASALIPILRASSGCWIGWTGTEYDGGLPELLRNWATDQHYSFVPVFLTAAERTRYQGFSNEIIWPLFHGLPSRCQFDSSRWHVYCRVNAKFADAVECASDARDFIWVHDYHLMMLADALRTRGLQHRLAYFHEISFPSPDIFEMLPWRVEVLRGLMQHDVVGFQTLRDRRNFIACLRRYLPGVRVNRIGETLLVRAENQCARIETCPVSIEHEEFANGTPPPALVFQSRGDIHSAICAERRLRSSSGDSDRN